MAGSQTTLHNNDNMMKGDNEKMQRSETASIQKAELPAGSRLNADGVPTYMGLTGHTLIWTITIAASFGFGLFGYDQGVMSGLISAPEFYKTFPDVDPSIQGSSHAATMQAFYVAIYEIGCLFGAVFALAYGDRLGRVRMMKLACYTVCIGVLIQITSFAGHKAGVQFIIGRVVTGLGNGANTATIPTWHAETAKSHNRGLLVCIEAAMISTGTAVAYWVDYGLSFVPNSASWRVPIALQVLFAFGLLAMISGPQNWRLPESPRWLVSAGHYAEAQRVIAALEPAPFHSDVVVEQTRVILDSLEGAKARKKTDVLTRGPTQHLRRMLIGASSQIMQQIGGCNAVIYFAPVIFQEELRLERNLSLILGGVNVTVYALAAFLCFYLIERLGRRKLFLVGSAGQALSMFLIMACTRVGSEEALKGAVVGMFLYLVFFGFTWLQLPWLYPAEINPLATRTNANAISTINNWLFNFAIVMATPPLLEKIEWATFLIFGVLNLSFIPIIYVFYPETAGRTLEEIDVIFAIGYVEKKSYVKVAKEMPSLDSKAIEAEFGRLGLGQVTQGNSAHQQTDHSFAA